jgi:HK97 family phage portal protein
MATVFLQSDGLLAPLGAPMVYGDPSVYISDVLHFSADPLANPDEVWKTQRAVRTVVGFIARNVASIGLHGFKKNPETHDHVRIDDSHPLARTLKSPDGVQTQYEYLYDYFVDISLWERYAAAKVRGTDGTVKLLRLPPRKWRFARGGRDEVIGIRIGEQTFPLERFVWSDGYPGSADSPMSHLISLLREETESTKFRASLWENGARHGGWIERPLEAPDWTPRARQRFKNGLRSAYTGDDGTNLGGTMLLEDGMKYHSVDHITSRDAQQIEARKLSISEVAAAYHVPPVFVGVLDNANYSNVTAYKQMLYSDVLGPLLVQSQQAATLRLVSEFGGVDFVEHNVGEKLRLSFEEQAGILLSAVGGPIMTRNEARQRVNLPNLGPEGDEIINPLNVDAGGGDDEEETETPDPASEEEQTDE